jgi:protein-tyrosine phosphatase
MSTRILMVCLGNICRSPMAEGVLRHLVRERGLAVTTDSAGTSGHHRGEAPDRRAVRAMQRHGIDISDLRARQFVVDDLHRFDRILVMDEQNLADILALAPSPELAAKVSLIMDLAPERAGLSVPDPYYGGDEGFEAVYRMLDEACAVLAADLVRHG